MGLNIYYLEIYEFFSFFFLLTTCDLPLPIEKFKETDIYVYTILT